MTEYDPEEAGVGYHVSDPLGDVEKYSEYPETRDEFLSYNARETIWSVFEAVGGKAEYVAAEMNVPNSHVAGFLRKFGRNHDEDLEERYSDHYVVLDSATVTVHDYRQGDRMVEVDPVSWHVFEFENNNPLEDSEFLATAFSRNMNPAAVSDLLAADITPRDVKDAYIAHGHVDRDYVEVDGERYELDDFHEKPWCDARLLEIFDEADWSLAKIAKTFGVEKQRVRKQAESYGLT